MNDYIKRGYAKTAICSSCANPCSLVEKANSPCVTIIELARIPSADVAPVRHGRWIYHMDDLYPEESTMECSVCGDFIFIRGESDNYCPNCGARMDGESDE